MIRFRIKEQLAEMSFRKGARVRLDDVAAATGIHRVTLSKIGSPSGCNTSTDNLDRLCNFFGCQIQDLVEYIPSEPPAPRTRTKKESANVDAGFRDEK
jgi:putative transcriptional regulator